jgi:SAM-dependent methyltransferase
MTSGEIVPDKDRMRAYWQARGAAWDRWADTVAASAERLDNPLIAAARIEPGARLLDLASGAGQPALAIAAQIARVQVTATDLLPEMLEGARRRAREAALGNVSFEIADMAALPFADDSFDRVTCRFGIMFVPDAAKALKQVRRVLRAGGRAAFMVWGAREDTTMFRVITGTADRILGPDPAEDMAAAFRFAAPGSLAALFTAAGFAPVVERELKVEGSVPLGTAFWRPQVEMSLGPRLAKATEAQRAAVGAAIEEAFGKEVADGRYRLNAHTRIVTGDKPG